MLFNWSLSDLIRVLLIFSVLILVIASGFQFYLVSANASAYGDALGPQYPRLSAQRVEPTHAPRQSVAVTQIISQSADPLISEFLGVAQNDGFLTASLAAEKLFRRGSIADIEFLFQVLSLETPPGFSEQEWQAMQSRSLSFLVSQSSWLATVELRLINMLGDAQVTEFVKSGIVASSDLMYENSAAPEDIETLLWQICESQRDNMASLALASLARISQRSNTIDAMRLNDMAARLFAAPDASAAVREVATEVVNWLKSHKVYHRAVNVLQNQNAQSDLVQLAAINTLRLSGRPENIQLLEGLVQSENPRLRSAASQAIAALIN